MNINNVYMKNVTIKARSEGIETAVGGVIGFCGGSYDKIENILVNGNIYTNLEW